MAAVALFFGSCLIVTYLNDEARALFKGQSFEGLPYVEAFVGPNYAVAGEVMKRVNETRRAEAMPWFSGVLWILPIEGGVAMHFRVAPAPRRTTPLMGAYLPAPVR